MPFSRPSLVTLIDRAATDIEAILPGTDARLRRSNLAVLARVSAGGAHGLYGFLDFVARQLFADTAEAEYLDRHASIWGIDRIAASYASGPATFTGVSGTLIPDGTSVQRSDGKLYFTQADATLSSGTATVTVRAGASGVLSNTAASSQLALVAPIAGVNSNATVGTGGLVGGADREADDALRLRLLARLRQAPMGGTALDYIAWALEVPGVTRAWCYPLEGGPGKVVVRFVRDGDANFIPDSTEVALVQSHINPLAPVCADVTVLAPTAVNFNCTIHVEPDTSAVRAAVTAELRDLILREAAPGGTILLSHIREAISTAAGESDHTLTSPSANVVYGPGNIPKFNTITWT